MYRVCYVFLWMPNCWAFRIFKKNYCYVLLSVSFLFSVWIPCLCVGLLSLLFGYPVCGFIVIVVWIPCVWVYCYCCLDALLCVGLLSLLFGYPVCVWVYCHCCLDTLFVCGFIIIAVWIPLPCLCVGLLSLFGYPVCGFIVIVVWIPCLCVGLLSLLFGYPVCVWVYCHCWLDTLFVCGFIVIVVWHDVCFRYLHIYLTQIVIENLSLLSIFVSLWLSFLVVRPFLYSSGLPLSLTSLLCLHFISSSVFVDCVIYLQCLYRILNTFGTVTFAFCVQSPM